MEEEEEEQHQEEEEEETNSGELLPDFKMEDGKMEYLKGGHFDFSSGDNLSPGYHTQGDNIVYGHGDDAMSRRRRKPRRREVEAENREEQSENKL